MKTSKLVHTLRYAWVLAGLVAFLPAGVAAQDDRINPQVQTSPFPPLEANDNTFVVDDGPFLDTGCSFRSDGPLIIELEVTRYVGEVDANGYLQDADFLIANNLLSPTVKLIMPAYDVDYGAVLPPPDQPERDRVSFNGEEVGYLFGFNDTWILNTFEIDVRKIKFPQAAAEGGTITPAINEIRIDIDVANAGELWCTAIDWVALTPLKAWRPVLLVHGLNGEPDIWNSIWIPKLNDLKVKNQAIQVGKLASIEDNGAMIGDGVAVMRQMYGVDRVNIVCHSKGGLDSRYYIRSHNDVSALMMIATPNAGSPLADYAQGLGVLLFGGLGTALLDLFAAPAAYQLTTFYMALYNSSDQHNPKTHYRAMAGNHSPDGTFAGAWYLPGLDDEIVQVSSVHTFDYTLNLIHTSDDELSEHSGLHQSEFVYLAMLGPIKTPSTDDELRISGYQAPIPDQLLASNSKDFGFWIPRTRRTAAAGAVEQVMTGRHASQNSDDVQRTASQAGYVANGVTNSHVITVDSATEAFMQLTWGIDDLDLELVDPDGNHIDPDIAAIDPNIEYTISDGLEGLKVKGYYVNNPTPGNWTFEVTGTSVTSANGEGYGVTAQLSGSILSFSASTNFDAYRKNEAIVITATIMEGSTPATNAAVTAALVLPDETKQTLTLYDDGTHGDPVANDGQYFNTFTNTSQGGAYRILTTAQRTTESVFSREEAKVVTVSSTLSEFNGLFDDIGFDSDSDGLFNQLRIEIGVDVETGGEYGIKGELYDANGGLIEAATLNASLNAGSQTVELAFDGFTIFAHGVNGPYTLRQLTLTENSTAGSILADYIPDAHTTAAYNVNDFQRPAILLTGNSNDFGIDHENDGFFNQLQVEVEVNLRFSDSYQWSARLVDGNGAEIDVNAQSGFLNNGLANITFIFDGRKIRAHGVNGPYFVKDLLMFGTSGPNLVALDVAETEPYDHTEFQGDPEIEIAPSSFEVTLTQGNSISETLTLENNGAAALNFDISLVQATTAKALTGKHELMLSKPGNSRANTSSPSRSNLGDALGPEKLMAFDPASGGNPEKFSLGDSLVLTGPGQVIGTIPAPGSVLGLTYLNNALWAVVATSPQQIMQLDPVSGNVLSAFFIGTDFHLGLANDGSSLWVCNFSAGVIEHYTTTGTFLGSFAAPMGTLVRGIACDGLNLWIGGANHGTLYKTDFSGNILQTVSLPTNIVQWVMDMEWVPQHTNGSLWIIDNSGNNDINQFDVASGSAVLIQQFPHPAPSSVPEGVAHDGEHLWSSAFNSAQIYHIDDGVLELGICWLEVQPASGTVNPGEQAAVAVNFTAVCQGTLLAPGDYAGQLLVNSNDLDEPQIAIPVQLHVLSLNPPEIEVTPGSFSFNVPLEGSAAGVMTIANVAAPGSDDLDWNLTEEEAALVLSNGQALPARLQITPSPSRAILTPSARAMGSGKLLTESNPATLASEGTASDPGIPAPQENFIPSPVAATTLLIGTTPIENSIRRALNELGVAHDLMMTSDFTGIDFGPYQTIIVGMDGGSIETASVQALASAAAAGKSLIMYGGTNYQPYYEGMSLYLLQHTGAQGWTISSIPHLTVTAPADPLAADLPSPYNYANPSAAFYMLRINDPAASVVAVNGDGFPALVSKSIGSGNLIYSISSAYDGYYSNAPDFAVLKTIVRNAINSGLGCSWLSENPTSGALAPGSSQNVSVLVDAAGLAPGLYACNLLVNSNDPDEAQITVPVQLNVFVDAVIWIPPDVFEPDLARQAAQRGLAIETLQDMVATPTSHLELKEALEANGKSATIRNTLTAADLANVDYLFVVLGIYPNNHTIKAGDPEAAVIENFIAAGGKVYIEGGDVWYFDPQFLQGHDFGPSFGINPLADGDNDLKTIEGACVAAGKDFSYSGQNNFIDRLAPNGSAACTIHSNSDPDYNCGVAFEGPGPYRTIGVSFEFGGLDDVSLSGESKAALMAAYLDFFDNGASMASAIFDFPLANGGWYLISLPVTPNNSSVASLFPTALAAFGWNFSAQAYAAVTELVPGQAYWLAMPSATTIQVTGQRFEYYDRSYTSSGWDLFGALTLRASPQASPNANVFAMFRYNPMTGNYESVRDFEPGQGYWVGVIASADEPVFISVGSEGGAPAATGRGMPQEFAKLYGEKPPSPPPFTIQTDKLLALPRDYALSQNYPNPFNPETVIEYQLPEKVEVILKIYTVLGRDVRTLVHGEMSAGVHQIKWDGKDDFGAPLDSGVYLFQIKAGSFSHSRKLLLIK